MTDDKPKAADKAEPKPETKAADPKPEPKPKAADKAEPGPVERQIAANKAASAAQVEKRLGPAVEGTKRVRVLKTCLYGGIARYAGNELRMSDAVADDFKKRGLVEHI